jgi:hypothetical protein
MFYWRWFNRPRHPLMRVFLASIGAVLLVGVLVFGFFALVAFAFIGSIVAIVRSINRAGTSSMPHAAGAVEQRVIEGEFVVLRNDAAPLNH